MKRFGIMAVVLIASGASSRAETLSFPKVWQQVDSGSAAEDSARLMMQSASEAKERASRHWLPRLYLDARTYESNDPGAAFMGLLEQRSLRQNDFNPDSINHPDNHLYSRAALGLDLPLYQGGAGEAQVEVGGAAVSVRSAEAEQVRLDQYAETGKAYGSLAALDRGLKNLGEVQASVERLHRGYQLGAKSNPVGYSGALGMKALGQRLEALTQQYSAEKRALLAELREFGVAALNWSPEALPAPVFADRYFAGQSAPGGSHRLESLRGMAEMNERSVALEKGKLLPQFGVFAEGYGFNGARDTAAGYSAGLYLRWSLFNPADYGSMGEAKLKAASAERYAEAAGQEERAALDGLRFSLQALRANIGILQETEQVLREQANVTETLFKNGSVNALQFVEVVSRRADLAVQQLETDLNFLKLSAQVFSKERSDIAALIRK